MMQATPKHLRWAALALPLTVMLAGCAGPNPRDPYEGFNRAMFSFNDTVDTYRAEAGRHRLQERDAIFVQTGVNNFFGNLSDAWSAINNLLQARARTA
jgi:phospholipid-binding lipoprotein MlaA